ncbi:XIAP-associated factor 1 [Trematomus bernacchii]|uniref:XIAP-associated factor 1 n=1 Tax=Trematomus bernacchii TaxID=40690 RepID=UPI001469AC17|nr:XIAP-associated factor 1 [Trematomus bernacchii]
MEKQEATRTCGQCHKEVAEVNFALHETHCSRFLVVCPDCEETVPREQLDTHREEQHTEVRCSRCHQKMERCQLLDHESAECEQRLQVCLFCDLELPVKDLQDHSVACGSRTELCGDCGRYVTLKLLNEHTSTCPGTQSGSEPAESTRGLTPHKETITVNCTRCLASFPIEDIEQHEMECVSSSSSRRLQDDKDEEGDDEEDKDEDEEEDEDKPEEEERNGWDVAERGATASKTPHFLSKRPSRDPRGDTFEEEDPDQISCCPHCHLALPLPTLRWHQAKCQIHVGLK